MRHNTNNFAECSYMRLPVEFNDNTISLRYKMSGAFDCLKKEVTPKREILSGEITNKISLVDTQ